MNCPRCGSPAQQVPLTSPIIPEAFAPQGTPQIHPVEVLLDNIRSTFNVGAMFRTSDGAGIKHIHVCGTTPPPTHPKISKTALGAEFAVSWTYHTNAVLATKTLKDANYQIWALENTPTARNIFEVISTALEPSPILLIVGNEVTGVDPGLIDLCDNVLSIPMLGYKRSLNVAIAFGIAAYSLCFSESFVRPSHPKQNGLEMV